MDTDAKMSSLEPMDLLSESWCSSAIQVFQPAIRESSIMPLETNNNSPSLKSDKNLKLEDGESKLLPPWKLDDLKSWIWVQQAMHPELDYDICFRKKWFSKKFKSWTGNSIKKWVKEMKRKRKEEERLQRAEVHAAISVAGVASALAAIAADNTAANQAKSLKETAVASAAALIAAQCAQVAEAAGARKDQLASAIDAATTATDASNIITLTAAAATSLRGAATLRGRPDHKERIKGSALRNGNDGVDFDYERCRALLAKGEELQVRTPDGKCRFRTVTIVLNIDGQVLLKIKKLHLLTVFSSAKESIVYNLHGKPVKEPIEDGVAYFSINMTTSQGRIELIIDDYMQYRTWTVTINHMLMLTASFGKCGSPLL
ncbi:uncharacterized protein A4U43_C05F25560 [Asparagus officinalis]|uniref:PH domain-containing protein n=1 Tax=Asparagus officinalis TaxID=4686 RepID=A0A5P1EUK5_ASPOF|nr:VAN3-binding protein [Asparagus officinalis]ONK69676.1 uncharacterized protein A4U43_C05F25560 [Asparagus officinalis]